MATPSTDIATKISTEAASNFVERYYPALNNARDDISSFYMEASTMTDGKPLPIIVYNGNIVQEPSEMQKMFKDKMPESCYEVETYDCQVMNPHYVPQAAEGAKAETGKNMVILLTVSGSVRYGDTKAALNPMRVFSESIVLVPNPAAAGNQRGVPVKEWVIQSQNFRLVV